MSTSPLDTLKNSLATYVTNNYALLEHQFDHDTRQTIRSLRNKYAFTSFLSGLKDDKAKQCREIALSYVPFGLLKSGLRTNTRSSVDDEGIISLDVNGHYLKSALAPSNSDNDVETFVEEANQEGWEKMFYQVAQAQTRPQSDFTNPNPDMSGYQNKLKNHFLPAISSVLLARGQAEVDPWLESFSGASHEEVYQVARTGSSKIGDQHDPKNTAPMGETTLGPLTRQPLTLEWLNSQAEKAGEVLQKSGGTVTRELGVLADQEGRLEEALAGIELEEGWESSFDLFPILVKAADLEEWNTQVVLSVKDGEEYNDSIQPKKHGADGGDTEGAAA
jgi:hypothetical protein